MIETVFSCLCAAGNALCSCILSESLFAICHKEIFSRPVRIALSGAIALILALIFTLFRIRIFSLPYFLMICLSDFLADRFVYRMNFQKSIRFTLISCGLFILAWLLCVLFNPSVFSWSETSMANWSQSLVQILMMILVLKAFASLLIHIISNRIPVYSDPKIVLFILYAAFLSVLIPVLIGAAPEINHLIVWVFPGSLVFTLIFVFLIFSDRQHSLRQIEELRAFGKMQKEYVSDLKKANHQVLEAQSSLQRLIEESAALIRENRMEDARKLLEQIPGGSRKEMTGSWTLNPVINALLHEKAAICAQKNIELECSIAADERLNIDSLDLCRALGNILDNAIRSCSRTENAEKSIFLHVYQKNGYLMIHCKNPFLPDDKGKTLGTGYGHQILREIAEKYEGRFKTDSDDQGEFEARLILKIPESEQDSVLCKNMAKKADLSTDSDQD